LAIKDHSAALGARRADRELVARLAQRDEAALGTLIDLCGKHIYGKALQILIEPQLAEEVAQDTLLVLWWHPERFDSTKGTIRSFLLGIARYKAIDAVRREQTVRSTEALLTEAGSFFETSQTDDEVENAVVVRAAISTLPLAKREVIFLAFYKGLTYRQVGEVLNLPEGTVKTRIRDSLVRLKATMEIANGETA
jgi:RNA polymerase sigma-70 factor (ECF subfamily)